MSAANSLHARLGSLVLPVDESVVETERTLTVLDPARRILVDLFKAAIEAELTGAWRKATVRLAPAQGLSTTTPVADTLEMDPAEAVMQQRKTEFPLLAVYRDGEGRYEPHQFDSSKLVQQWTVDWILGPADVAKAFQFLDAGTAISKILHLLERDGGHPAYQSGTNVLGEGGCEFGAFRVVSHVGPGQSPLVEGGTPYYGITIRLETEEYPAEAEGLPAYGPFDGADYDVGIGGTPEGVIHGLVYGDTDHPG